MYWEQIWLRRRICEQESDRKKKQRWLDYISPERLVGERVVRGGSTQDRFKWRRLIRNIDPTSKWERMRNKKSSVLHHRKSPTFESFLQCLQMSMQQALLILFILQTTNIKTLKLQLLIQAWLTFRSHKKMQWSWAGHITRVKDDW